ncbi:unnamed protein product [Rotaria sordida]|uniref:F-box domain-containing protein n=1 Tax=Rotaria sordida TaxID=392033 RepID=A0A814LGW4_9BILA|nr:unnamed protein product [Rotaria sordida]
MEQIKRHRSNSYDNDDESDRRKKLQLTTVENNCLSREIITYFEHLSNELIYEIFEFLDYFRVYKAFFNLNERFHSLLTNSTLLIQINLSSISKSVLQRYYKDIIIRNRHRINLLRLSNLFIYDDFAFLLFHKILKFRRLETLILDNIESYCLENLLYQLTSSPFLSFFINHYFCY